MPPERDYKIIFRKILDFNTNVGAWVSEWVCGGEYIYYVF